MYLESEESEEEEPVKKVPFGKVTKKAELPKPKVQKEPESVDENSNRKYDNKIDYNKERDSRTVFIKNLPFDTTVDDLWEVFGENDEETCLECRFITNKETGKHKVYTILKFIFINCYYIYQLTSLDWRKFLVLPA